ncbi:Wsc4-like protein [Macrophomina phaseolina]|uniref:Wsc4-like protein n=1 Tax=Macrophomina phaseolina TaxID=35725 RepID=A0ABQ8GRA1_9PEZI|nr:Wsc4-like protein [Macrophomina phaseolina]
MNHHQPSLLQLLLSLLTITTCVSALTQSLCSGTNTGTDNLQDTYTYQSLGHCHDKCNSDFAYAIVQGKNCWCSNYAPANTEDVGNCNDACPGYPFEYCGNSDDGLYGYLKLDLAASGTQGASSASSTSTKATSTSKSSTSSSAAAATTTSSSSSSDESTSSTRTETPTTQVTVVTVGGSVVTQTVTSSPSLAGAESGTGSGGSSVSGGQIAGAVIGGLAGLALIAAAVVWFLLRIRRRQEQQAGDAEGGSTGGVTPQRNVSTLSRTGLLRSGEKDYTATLPPINTTRQSSDPSDTITPISERRNSRPLFHDQRLNPQPFLSLDNGSHASIISIEDNRDYTRTLNVRNPDPPEARTSRDSW